MGVDDVMIAVCVVDQNFEVSLYSVPLLHEAELMLL